MPYSLARSLARVQGKKKEKPNWGEAGSGKKAKAKEAKNKAAPPPKKEFVNKTPKGEKKDNDDGQPTVASPGPRLPGRIGARGLALAVSGFEPVKELRGSGQSQGVRCFVGVSPFSSA